MGRLRAHISKQDELEKIQRHQIYFGWVTWISPFHSRSFLRGISETISLAYLQAYNVSFQSHWKMSAGPWKASQTSLLPVAPRDRDIHHKSHFWKSYPATNSIVFLLLHRVPLSQSQMAPKPEKSHPQYPFKNYKEPKTKNKPNTKIQTLCKLH